MAPLSAPEIAHLAAKLQTNLASTRFACSSLEQLTGGTTSFVFLGTLVQPLFQDGEEWEKEECVIVKHAAPFASCETSFLVDKDRGEYEAFILWELQSFNPKLEEGIAIKTPACYWFDAKECVLVIQYVPSSLPLHTSLPSVSLTQADRLGRALGTWLKRFHDFGQHPTPEEVREKIAKNKTERAFKHYLTWGQGSDMLERLATEGLLTVNEEEIQAWDAAKARAKDELHNTDLSSHVVVHGDFWAGNVLISTPTTTPTNTDTPTLTMIDFEFSHLSSRATDLGQFIGDILEKFHFSLDSSPSLLGVLRAFLDGYGIEDGELDLRWRTLIHAGVYVITWWARGPPGRTDQSEETRQLGLALAKKGLGFVRAGWEKDESAWSDLLRCDE